MKVSTKVLLVFCVTFAAIIPRLWAKIGEFDEVWQQRAEEAKQNTLEAYVPLSNEKTQEEFIVQDKNSTMDTGSYESDNEEDEEAVNNSTRRNLGQHNGHGQHKTTKYTRACNSTNPIDRCWRCRKDWATDRKRLARCARGFGRKTTGGLDGRIYVVTDNSDDSVLDPKPGTLRHAVIHNEPLWIIFAKDMNIKLKKELIMTSHKTIDGRGAKVHISYGAGFTIQFISNVIIHGLHIHHIISTSGGLIRDSVDHFGLRTTSDGDGINIFGSTNIWIDHVSMSNCTDGLIDAIEGSTAITISNSKFTNHNDVILLGAHDQDSGDQMMQVTVAFNHFGQGLYQRMPRCRWGFFHVVNNDYTHWRLYAIGGSGHPTIISQGNRFIAPYDQYKEVTKRDYATEDEWMKWSWRSEGDFFMNGAYFVQSGSPNVKRPDRKFMITPKPGFQATRMTRCAGALDCVAGTEC